MEDFARFQDSQNTRKAYLAEAAELAYLGRSGGEWGLGLTELARDQIVNAVGYRLPTRGYSPRRPAADMGTDGRESL